MVGSFELDTINCPLQYAEHTERDGNRLCWVKPALLLDKNRFCCWVKPALLLGQTGSVVGTKTFRFEKCFHNKSRSGNENKILKKSRKREKGKGRKEIA